MQFATKEVEIQVRDQNYVIKTVNNLDDLLAQVEEDDDIPFWAELWPAAIGLANFLADYGPYTGSSFLELGAGLGLPGIVAARLGGKVLQSDFVPAALEFCQINAKLNGVTPALVQGDWRNFPQVGKFDWCIASDILYEPNLFPDLLKVLSQVVQPGGKTIISDPGREFAQQFMSTAEQLGWLVSKTQIQVQWDGWSKEIDLYELQRHG